MDNVNAFFTKLTTDIKSSVSSFSKPPESKPASSTQSANAHPQGRTNAGTRPTRKQTALPEDYKNGEASSYTPADNYALPKDVIPKVVAPTAPGKRRLVVCVDGTWSSVCTGLDLPSEGGQATHLAATPTNVFKLAFLAGASDIKPDHNQLVYYHAGPGAGRDNKTDDFLQGLFGNIDPELLDAYRWLARTYKPNDEIYAFGFSRGSTIVRSLYGFIRNCGLIKVSEGLTDEEFKNRVEAAYDVYQERPQKVQGEDKQKEWDEKREKFKAENCWESVDLKFIGVFDTVGELGVPKDLYLGSWIERLGNYFKLIDSCAFHDTKISPSVPFAYHALAIDETRELFSPTLFEDIPTPLPPTIVEREQVWFRGEHSDIGGGWFEDGLPSVSLLWMLEKARKAGLVLKKHEEYEIVGRALVMGVREEHIEKNRKAYVVHDPFKGAQTGTSFINERIFRDFEYYQDPTRFFPSSLHPSVFSLALDAPPPDNLFHYLEKTNPAALNKWPGHKHTELTEEEKLAAAEQRKKDIEKLELKDTQEA
ncbi:hypothetical protein HDV00_011630 [Rhizophlyctis rosea]|nr:hypothetical protein HDV00_011630 [Rhizophlyctis rosea]